MTLRAWLRQFFLKLRKNRIISIFCYSKQIENGLTKWEIMERIVKKSRFIKAKVKGN